MHSLQTALLLGGLFVAMPAAADQANGGNGPGSNPSKLTADPMGPGPLTMVPPPLHGPSYGEGISDDLSFTYHGYLSAPILVTLGEKNDANPNRTSTPLHSLTLNLPDYTYNTWMRTNAQPGAWANMNFAIGTNHVYASVIMGAWNFNQGRETQQNTSYAETVVSFYPVVDFKSDDLFNTKTRMDLQVGGMVGRYGTAGKYDSGPYGAPVVGAIGLYDPTMRRLPVGEQLALERDFGDVTVRVEEGLGANGQGSKGVAGTTLVAHAHAMGSYKEVLKGGIHYLTSWTQDERIAGADPDGSIKIVGADARFNGGIFGELFLGASYVKLTHAEHVDGSIQVVNVASGQSMMDNFLGPDRSPQGNDHGTGSLRNVLVQYDYSLATLARYPETFWGNGPDLKVTLFGMYTRVGSFDPFWDKVSKLKFGTDIVYSPLDWLAVALRLDRVIPNMNTDPSITDPSDDFRAKITGQNFSIVSPRLIFRSSFVAHEVVALQYSRYFYGTFPNGQPGVPQTPKADLVPQLSPARPFDRDVFSLGATMWF
jgi:hypothetical protein